MSKTITGTKERWIAKHCKSTVKARTKTYKLDWHLDSRGYLQVVIKQNGNFVVGASTNSKEYKLAPKYKALPLSVRGEVECGLAWFAGAFMQPSRSIVADIDGIGKDRLPNDNP